MEPRNEELVTYDLYDAMETAEKCKEEGLATDEGETTKFKSLFLISLEH